MKLKLVAAAALLVLGSTAAQANAFTWEDHGLVEVGLNVPGAGVSFTDTFLFEITPVPYTVSSTAVANNLGDGFIFNIQNGKYSLWSAGADMAVGGGDDALLSPYFNFGGASGDITNSVDLSTGFYFYEVKGDATGVAGGFYTLTSTIVAVPVPEPETYAMMLAGLGALGFLARRRRND